MQKRKGWGASDKSSGTTKRKKASVKSVANPKKIRGSKRFTGKRDSTTGSVKPKAKKRATRSIKPKPRRDKKTSTAKRSSVGKRKPADSVRIQPRTNAKATRNTGDRSKPIRKSASNRNPSKKQPSVAKRKSKKDRKPVRRKVSPVTSKKRIAIKKAVSDYRQFVERRTGHYAIRHEIPAWEIQDEWYKKINGEGGKEFSRFRQLPEAFDLHLKTLGADAVGRLEEYIDELVEQYGYTRREAYTLFYSP